ncbi:MAG: aldehyde ferredoxin oxidoreductase C-terminal domain-containing protein, partial [Rectinemataceae bacterium]|nr:aldehyde ferredoxin oxidoreductase C-terminal domain-containing protein [Rectinemataceae bacterium]
MSLSMKDFTLLAEWKYDEKPIYRGYNMRTLAIDVGAATGGEVASCSLTADKGSAAGSEFASDCASSAKAATPAGVKGSAYGAFTEKPVSEDFKRRFVGGKGFGLKLLWDAVSSATKWNDPENEIVIAMGPVCGNTNYPGSGKSLVTSISPLTGVPIDSNVGGYFGPFLKFSGFDALELSGKAACETVVFIDGVERLVRVYAAPEGLESDTHILAEKLTHAFAGGAAVAEARTAAGTVAAGTFPVTGTLPAAPSPAMLHAIACVSAGRGAENTPLGVLNFSLYDKRRAGIRVKQAGRGGIGTVLRDKKIKALICRYEGVKQDSNAAADPAAVQRIGLKLHREIVQLDDRQCKMRKQGTAHLMEVMNDYDLLPTKNHKFGQDPRGPELASWVWEKLFSQNLPDGCWYGCTLACAHAVDKFLLETGPYAGTRVCVDGPEYETAAGCGSNLAIWEPQGILEINFYCDTYGVDTISFGTITSFLMECWENGLLDLERTGGIDLTWGNWRGACELLHAMADGRPFGIIAGKGCRFLADYMVREYGADPQFMKDIALHGKGLEQSQYISKESLAQQGGYYLTNKGPQHDEAWLIFMDMVNNRIPSFENKAEALHYFPMFRTWFGLQGLCKLPWNDIEPGDNSRWSEPNKVPEHVDNYRELYTAITGEPLDWPGLIRQSERVYNFQRVFNLRMGHGRRAEDYPPYRAMGPVTGEEYLSRAERYDKQLVEKMDRDPTTMTLAEKIAAHRVYRMDRYESLVD